MSVKNKKAPFLLSLVLAVLLLGLISSCTQYKNTFIHRGYHNMTSRYNVYFYARESLKEAVRKLEKNNKDDYTRILPVFIYGDEAASKAISPELDRAVKKASLSITRHTIKDKHSKREIVGAVRWIDNSWNVLGKAQFYKREFFSGVETFEYVANTYKSKERYEAWLWLLKTYNAMNLLSAAEPYITRIKNEKNFPKEFKDEFAALYAEFYIKQGLYEEAVKQMEEAINLTKNKQVKARYHFILGQLHEQNHNNQKAIFHFNKALSLKPAYDMVFNVKIKRALLAEPTPDNNRRIKHELTKMIPDIKNEEYLDVIYYTLGQLEERDKNEDKSIEDYKLSVQNSVNNNNQKAKSYLRLGDISFDRTNYTAAEAYYDSTVTLIKEDFPGYEKVLNKKKSLTTLVGHIRLINREDSLQKVAAMDSASRTKFIEKMITKIEEEEQRRLEEQQNIDNSSAQNNGNTTAPITNPGDKGAWYFYNQQTRAFGINDFVKKWGNNRKLEDNWRRSNKQATIDPIAIDPEKGDTALAGADSTKKNPKTDTKSVAYYMTDLPLTAALVDSSNKRIVESYYALGTIYREQLGNHKKAIETFETLNRRFPKNKYEASDYYQMYRMHLEDRDKAKAEEKKNFLCTNYASSDYCKIINDPGYGDSVNARKSEVEAFYAATYKLYSENNFNEALSKSEYALTRYGKNDFTPRFALLKALAIGHTQPVDSLEKALRYVVVKYPKDPVYDPAKAMLDAIAKRKNPAAEVKDTTQQVAAAVTDSFRVDDNAEHYWVIALPNGKGDPTQMRSQLSDFHNTYYSTAGLKTMSVQVGNYVLVTVKSLKNKSEAMVYHNLVLSKNEVVKNMPKELALTFAITADNLAKLIKNKNVAEYNNFFNKNYLGLKQ